MKRGARRVLALALDGRGSGPVHGRLSVCRKFVCWIFNREGPGRGPAEAGGLPSGGHRGESVWRLECAATLAAAAAPCLQARVDGAGVAARMASCAAPPPPPGLGPPRNRRRRSPVDASAGPRPTPHRPTAPPTGHIKAPFLSP